jgi:hypothetical protein
LLVILFHNHLLHFSAQSSFQIESDLCPTRGKKHSVIHDEVMFELSERG